MGLRSGSAANILYRDCGAIFGLPIDHGWEKLKGMVKKERIVIARRAMDDDTFWNTCVLEVNFLVPDTRTGGENKQRLDNLEDAAKDLLVGCGTYNGYTYAYECIATGQEREPDLGCHYVNVKVKFDVLNVK